jgi:hypothetical protein
MEVAPLDATAVAVAVAVAVAAAGTLRDAAAVAFRFGSSGELEYRPRGKPAEPSSLSLLPSSRLSHFE